jgi:hypothetical protein
MPRSSVRRSPALAVSPCDDQRLRPGAFPSSGAPPSQDLRPSRRSGEGRSVHADIATERRPSLPFGRAVRPGRPPGSTGAPVTPARRTDRSIWRSSGSPPNRPARGRKTEPRGHATSMPPSRAETLFTEHASGGRTRPRDLRRDGTSVQVRTEHNVALRRRVPRSPVGGRLMREGGMRGRAARTCLAAVTACVGGDGGQRMPPTSTACCLPSSSSRPCTAGAPAWGGVVTRSHRPTAARDHRAPASLTTSTGGFSGRRPGATARR